MEGEGYENHDRQSENHLFVGRMIGRIIAITFDSDNEVYVSYYINTVLQCCQLMNLANLDPIASFILLAR